MIIRMEIERRGRSRGWLGLGTVALFTMGFALHCGSSGESTFDETCTALYGESCGKPCASDEQCAAGLHCAESKCNAQCGPSKACSDGRTCTATGRCTTDDISFQSDGSTTPVEGGPVGDACADLSVTLDKKTPTVMLLVDRSGSMSAAFGTGTRWTTLKNVLLDGGVIQTLQGEVNFGLAMYSNPPPRTSCPELVGVPYALDNFSAINGVLAPAGTNPDTPTGEAVLAVAGIADGGAIVDGGLASLDAGGAEKIILLVTDGDPDYCGNHLANDAPINPAEQQKAKDISVAAVRSAFQAGIKTYVLAIGSDVSIPHQQEMANTGLGFAADAGDAAPFFRPSDEAQLVAQIQSIIYGARPCKYELSAVVQAGFESQGKVILNGTSLGYGDPNGWRLSSPSEIELLGSACDTVRTAPSASLTATFPCGAVSDPSVK